MEVTIITLTQQKLSMSENVSLKDDLNPSEFEHCIETKVEVLETYQQVYDVGKDTYYVGESDFENVDNPEEEHICSCGETFDNRDDAYEHLKNAEKS